MTKYNYKELKELLIKYSKSYYQDGKSPVSDSEFDNLMFTLKDMEKSQGFYDPDSPSVIIVSDVTGTNVKSHKRPMLSLEDTRTHEEVKTWIDKVKEFNKDATFVCEYKYDGNSAAIRYVNSNIELALTRGDGEVGEDITNNVKNMSTLPIQSDNFTGEVRGEIIMLKEEFKRINVDSTYANPRNLVAGTLKLLDVDRFKERKLNFFGYWLEDSNNKLCSEDLEELIKRGFNNKDSYKICNTYDDVIKFIEDVDSKRESLPFEIDGVVIKVNNKDIWKEMGSTSKFPRWARAFKYEPISHKTKLKSVEYQVGRTGKITPVAILEPIFIAGSTVSRSTLSNIDMIKSLGLKLNDTVSVRKAMEIIPEIFKVHTELRDGSEVDINIITKCPICNSELKKESEDLIDYYCMNESCPDRVIQSIVYYTKALDIDGFAETTVRRLYNAGVLTSILDLYYMKDKIDIIQNLERFSFKVASKLINNIEMSRSSTFNKYLTAFGIKNVGPVVAKKITKKFNSIDRLRSAKLKDISSIEGVGNVAAESVIEYLKNNSSFLDSLINDVKIKLVSKVVNKVKNSPFKNKKIAITGELSKNRDFYKGYIENIGGQYVTSVSSKTDYLICNDSSGNSSKIRDAKKHSVKIITEDKLASLMGVDDKSVIGGVDNPLLDIKVIHELVRSILAKERTKIMFDVHGTVNSKSIYINLAYDSSNLNLRISDHDIQSKTPTFDLSEPVNQNIKAARKNLTKFIESNISRLKKINLKKLLNNI